MSSREKAAAWLWVALCLTACGGDGGDGDGNAGGGGTPGPVADCQTFFDPGLMAEGQDCSAKYGQYCALIGDTGASETRNEVPPCAGVQITEYEATRGDLQGTYLVIDPVASEPSVVYMALTWRNASAQRITNLLRLQELAKARNALVVAVNAPNALIGDIQAWPTSGLDETLGLGDAIGLYIDYLDQVRADIDERYDTDELPLYMSGLSNGGVMAAQYVCERSDRVDALMIVGGTLGVDVLDACEFSHPVGTVQVHGTDDLLTLYYGTPFTASIDALHQKFLSLNGCGPSAEIAQVEEGIMTIHFAGASDCSGGRRSYTVITEHGGHNWPGMDTLYINLSGPVPKEFDATVQGFDLMTLAAGR